MDAPRLHIEVQGEGATVVLGHGFAGSARNFRAQATALRRGFRVARFDARGHARSEAPDDPGAYTRAAFIADVGRVMDEVGARRAVVGGLSMGAGLALGFALAHPERVRGLVLAALPAGRGAAGSLTEIARELADAIECDGLEAAGRRYVWGPAPGRDPRESALLRRGILEHAPHALAHTLRGVIAVQPSLDELASALAGLARPALIVAGAADRADVATSERLAALLPEATLAVLDGAGHLVNLAQPDELNARVRAFLEVLGPET
jgi:pimeloyl-ACP methyl ester carboxylesterase